MRIRVLKSKIHRATVTEANLDYYGSITIDRSLMEQAGLIEGEVVLVANMSSGTRHETYVIPGPAESGVICTNGAAAHLVSAGDEVIIMAWAEMEIEQAKNFKPNILLVDKKNKPIEHIPV